MFLHVKDVLYLDGYRLRLSFNDNTIKDVDLEHELYGEIFEPLRDLRLFRQFALNTDTNTVEWPNGADFAPEFLHSIGTNVNNASRAAA